MRISLTMAALVVATAAHAADLGGPKVAPAPVAAPAPVSQAAPLGCYVGGSLGFGVTVTELKADDVKLPIAPNGVLGAVDAGCDLRIQGFLAVGAFGSYAIGEMQTSANLFGGSVKLTTDDVWAIGGRAGVYISEPTLLYVRLGYAGSTAKIDADEVANKKLNGILIGIGLETALTPHIGFRFAVDAYDWRHETIQDVKLEARTYTTSAGLLFRF